MDHETLFSIASTIAAVGWVTLAVLPGRRWVTERLCVWIIPGLLGLAYAILLASHLPRAAGGFGSLAEVAALFETSGLLLAGWLHYLAFDLFVGAWIAREGRRAGLPHLALLPCFLLTFLAGPVGFLLFLATRQLFARHSPEISS